MDNIEITQILEIYQKCINRIEDYLEYEWLASDKADCGKVRERITSYIDKLRKELNKTNKE